MCWEQCKSLLKIVWISIENCLLKIVIAWVYTKDIVSTCQQWVYTEDSGSLSVYWKQSKCLLATKWMSVEATWVLLYSISHS